MITITHHRQKTTPFLWFDNNAEAAITFYTSVFKNSQIDKMVLYGANAAMPEGTVLTAQFKMLGQEFLALNGGTNSKFTEAISLVVNCDTQEEIDYYWDQLSKGGEKGDSGWLEDKFGISWQVVPSVINKMINESNPEISSRVMDAVLNMKKLNIQTLEKAFSEGYETERPRMYA